MQDNAALPSVISFLPIQEGSGDPGIENVRNIRAPMNIDGIGEIYGGELDTQTGVLTETWHVFTFNSSSRAFNSGMGAEYSWFENRVVVQNSHLPFKTTPTEGDANGFFNIGDWRRGAIAGKNRGFVATANEVSAVFPVLDTTIDARTKAGRDAFYAYLTDLGIVPTIVYKLKTGISHQLATAQLRSAIRQLGY